MGVSLGQLNCLATQKRVWPADTNVRDISIQIVMSACLHSPI